MTPVAVNTTLLALTLVSFPLRAAQTNTDASEQGQPEIPSEHTHAVAPKVSPTKLVTPPTVQPNTIQPNVDAPSENALAGSSALLNLDPNPDLTMFQRWENFLRGEVTRLRHLDPYGATFQIPPGYLAFGWNNVNLSLGGRYDENGDYGPVIKPLQFSLGGEKQLDVLLDPTGTGGGHTFRFSYGIIENVAGFVEVPFSYMDLKVKPSVRSIDDSGNRIGEAAAGLVGVVDRKAYDAAAFLYDTLPKLGRPPIATRFRGKWLLGDIQLGLNWNYFRGKYYSGGLSTRLSLPTGRIPPPNQDLFYATGPEIQVGVGGWGAGLSHVFDVRLLNNFHGVTVVYSAELGGNYYFKLRRTYPTNFVKPAPGAAGLAPEQFPDLSELSGDFFYTPGVAVQLGNRLGIGWGPLGLSAGIVLQHVQDPYFDADPGFVGMVDSLGLAAQSSGFGFVATGTLNLLSVGIPLAVLVEYQRVLGGRNVIVFDNYIKIGVDMIGPLFVLWK